MYVCIWICICPLGDNLLDLSIYVGDTTEELCYYNSHVNYSEDETVLFRCIEYIYGNQVILKRTSDANFGMCEVQVFTPQSKIVLF